MLRNFVGEPVSVSLTSDISKKFIHERGISQCFVEIFLFHTSEEKKQANPLVFQQLLVIKKSFHERWDIMIFCRRKFSHCRKVSQGNPTVFHYFRVSESLVYIRGITQFSVDFFWLTLLKTFIGEPFNVSLISDISNNFIHRRGISRYFVEFFLFHNSEIKNRRTPWCSRNFWASKKLMHERWDIMIFCRRKFVSQCQKIIKNS